jgi:hypothetical protein
MATENCVLNRARLGEWNPAGGRAILWPDNVPRPLWEFVVAVGSMARLRCRICGSELYGNYDWIMKHPPETCLHCGGKRG